ncbi:MAG TPA: ABC transporter permease [Candidatus Lachnoclostridium pullistercoris]|uniref:ABC transporter permease n=1 Tax=Candidatus Lachnoclostridium pullistercoris TaxID=2838632 RepID=A0A9D2PAZ6_9FIRM|nr:ABC transporter permease [Candidatus Lachnoclostridium pullistercoris]
MFNNKSKNSAGERTKLVCIAIVFPILVLLFWQYASTHGLLKASLVPAPLTIIKTFISYLESGKLWMNLSVSFGRVACGYVIGAVAGVIVGFLMGLFKPVSAALSGIVSVLRPIPTIALVPIVILLAGIGFFSKVVIIAFGSFWPVLLNTIHGIQSVDGKLLEVAYTYRIPTMKTIWRIIVPSSIPAILTGLRLGMSSAWMSVVAAEMIASSTGIGYLITLSRETANARVMYMCVLVIGFIGLVIDKGLTRLENYYLAKTRGIVDSK